MGCGANETFCYSTGYTVTIGADVGAIRVLISAFADDADVTILPGVNEAQSIAPVMTSSLWPHVPQTPWPRWRMSCTDNVVVEGSASGYW
jgi:hypothetical protein